MRLSSARRRSSARPPLDAYGRAAAGPLFDDPADACEVPAPRATPETSRAAHRHLLPTKREACRRIIELVRAAGKRGLTLRELADILSTHRSSISGRLTELHREGTLAFAHDLAGDVQRRGGARVHVMGAALAAEEA